MEIAFCQTAFSQMRAEASHKSELISQLRFGEPVRILNRNEDWALVETEHHYQGWVRAQQLWTNDFPFDPFFQGLASKEQAASVGLPFSRAAFLWVKLELPGNKSFKLLPSETDNIAFGLQLSCMALSFLNVPYVWGGKTEWGLDCSALVQISFNLLGFSFPRDAWQQAELGISIPFDKERPVFETGDLLFFKHDGKKIHHVGISLGGARFVHASEWVRINSFSPEDEDFAEDRFQTLCLAKKTGPAELQILKKSITDLLNV
jgi:hypothetical protein